MPNPQYYILDENTEKGLQNKEIDYFSSDSLYEEQKYTEETKQLLEHFEKYVELFKKNPYDPSCGLTLSEFNRRNRNELFISLSGPMEEIYSSEYHTVINEQDKNEIPTMLFRSNNKPTTDLIIFIHGGGWTQGNFKTHEYLCRKLTKILEKDVLAIEYRLSPENPHPKPLDDVISVYKSVTSTNNFNNYQRFFLCGDSGGGHLCSAACIRISEESLKCPEASILFYPALGNDFNSRSYQKFGNCLALTKAGTIVYTNNLAGCDCQTPNILSNKYIFPTLQKDMTVFPKEIIISSGYDVLYDGQLEHVQKMIENGRKDIVWLVYPGVIHGFMTYGKYYDSLVTQVCHTIKNYLQ